ncbi:MAG: hypothetical protein Q4A06_04510 [Cardiobacteriaceae bacterium]|nr:hypothetical protein [Cardiobacteriaceae bacterium]
MKKTLLVPTLIASLAHAAATPEAAIEQLIQHMLDGNGEKAAALTHIAPELLAEGVDEAAFKAQLAQCYANTVHHMARDSGQTFAHVRPETAADGNHARLFVTMHEKNGGTSEMPPMDAVKNGNRWQIAFVGDILRTACPDLDVGDPRAVLQRYLDAWQRSDVDAAFALIHIDKPSFTDLTPDFLAEQRQEFAAFYALNASRKLRLADGTPKIRGAEAVIVVINETSGEEDVIALQKTARGWRLRYW